MDLFFAADGVVFLEDAAELLGETEAFLESDADRLVSWFPLVEDLDLEETFVSFMFAFDVDLPLFELSESFSSTLDFLFFFGLCLLVFLLSAE